MNRSDIGNWLNHQSVPRLTVAMPAVIAVVVGGLALLGLRRTVP